MGNPDWNCPNTLFLLINKALHLPECGHQPSEDSVLRDRLPRVPLKSAYTLFARQETQKIRKLSSGIRKLTDLFYIQCDKLEFANIILHFYMKSQYDLVQIILMQ